MPKFIIRHVETIEIEAPNREVAGYIAVGAGDITDENYEVMSVDYYFDNEMFDLEDEYELVPYAVS